MSWSEVINQRRAREVLTRGISTSRVAHAYLFYGPEGVGKRAAALAFAQSLQCTVNAGEACEQCDACRKVHRMVHPDVHVLFPLPGDAAPEDVGERIKQLGENPYAAVDYKRRPSLSDHRKVSNKQSIYTVARVNEELRRMMSFKPVEGRYKVAILTDIETMRLEAANAFLKLLEEPSPATVFVLISSRLDRILPTILSRCQRLRFDALQVSDIEDALAIRIKDQPDRVKILARMANGSFMRALELAESEDLLESRQLVLDYIRYAFSGHTDKLSDTLEQMAALGRERLKGLLQLMLSWIRDLMMYKTLGTDELLINIDQAESIRKFCSNLPDADVGAMVQLVEQSIELIGRNVQVHLVLIVLSQKLHRAMRGDGGETLYIPLHETESVVN